MSRQVRTQMPQTQKKDKWSKSKGKKFDKNACLLVFVLIFSGILIFLLLTASDNKKLNSTLNETFDFAKTRIERYEIYNTNDQVVSTNKQELLSSSVEESKSLYKNEFKVGGNGIVCLYSKAGNWYGREEKIKDYDAYIFFPESQVYITRNIVCVIYVLLALLLFSLYWVSRNRKEKYPSRSEETSCDQCTWPCIFFYFSCEYKNRENRNCKIFKEYETGSERGYSFQSAPGRTDTAGYYRAISGEIS